MSRIELRWLILSSMAAFFLLIYTVTLHAGYQTLRQQLLDQALNAQQGSAARLAQSADTQLKGALAELAYSASLLARELSPAEQESERLRRQSGIFASSWVVRLDDRVPAGTPAKPAAAGPEPGAPGRYPPAVGIADGAAAGAPALTVTQPIRTADGRYLGHIGGVLALEGMSPQARGDNRAPRHIYVLERTGRAHSPHTANLPEEVLAEAVRRDRPGAGTVTDAQGTRWLAGYAPLPSTDLSIMTLQPVETVLEPLSGLMLQTLKCSLPAILLALMACAWLGTWIARPLRQLADTARHWESTSARDRIKRVSTGYSEAERLRLAMLEGLGRLHRRLHKLSRESLTDPLTGLTNRRGKRLALGEWETQQRPFAVIVVDLDHFKQVNDTHGHEIGDQVIQFAGQLMRRVSRSDDLLCRVGGEEFMMLLPDASLETAAQIAERLRRSFAQEPSPTGEPISISAGVARWPGSGISLSSVLTRADEALYQAKRSGRNRIVTGDPA